MFTKEEIQAVTSTADIAIKALGLRALEGDVLTHFKSALTKMVQNSEKPEADEDVEIDEIQFEEDMKEDG